MRTLLTGLLLLLLSLPSSGQNIGDLSVGDSVVVEDALLQPKPKYTTNNIAHFGEPTPAEIIGPEEGDGYIQIEIEGKKGWVSTGTLSPIGPYRRLQRKKRKMRQEGYTVAIASQRFDRGNRGSIDVGLSLINVSDSKTLKYATATWELYNPVGDPVEKSLDSSTAETKFVGPLKPGKAGQSTFENVWNSNVGSCAELKRLVVEHIDGSSFTYVSDLEDIVLFSEAVRLSGDCSYKAQQKRK